MGRDKKELIKTEARLIEGNTVRLFFDYACSYFLRNNTDPLDAITILREVANILEEHFEVEQLMHKRIKEIDESGGVISH